MSHQAEAHTLWFSGKLIGNSNVFCIYICVLCVASPSVKWNFPFHWSPPLVWKCVVCRNLWPIHRPKRANLPIKNHSRIHRSSKERTHTHSQHKNTLNNTHTCTRRPGCGINRARIIQPLTHFGVFSKPEERIDLRMESDGMGADTGAESHCPVLI